MKKHEDEKPHVSKPHPEPEKHLDPKDARIKKLEDALNHLKENAVQGNYQHVKFIEGALAQ